MVGGCRNYCMQMMLWCLPHVIGSHFDDICRRRRRMVSVDKSRTLVAFGEDSVS